MSVSDLWVMGQGAAEYAEELDQEGRGREARFLEKVSALGLGVAIAVLLQKLGEAGKIKGARRAWASCAAATEASQAAWQRGATQMAGRAYLAAWREAQQHYHDELPPHIMTAMADESRGVQASETWAAQYHRPDAAAEESDSPAGDG